MSERSLDYGLRHNPVSITENYSKSLSQNSYLCQHVKERFILPTFYSRLNRNWRSFVIFDRLTYFWRQIRCKGILKFLFKQDFWSLLSWLYIKRCHVETLSSDFSFLNVKYVKSAPLFIHSIVSNPLFYRLKRK